MEIEMLTEEEILKKEVRAINTDTGTYYIYDIDDYTYVTIDDRGEHRKVWGYHDGKNMPPGAAEEWIRKIFDSDKEDESVPVKTETNTLEREERNVSEMPIGIVNAEKGVLRLSEEDSTKAVIEKAHEIAKAFGEIVEAQHLYAVLDSKKFLKVEAWQTLGALCNLSSICTQTQYLEIEGARGWNAEAIVVNNKGEIISRGEMICMNDEEDWRGRSVYQLKSMAQTRAISKAYRLVVSYIAVFAGFQATPFEEMVGVD